MKWTEVRFYLECGYQARRESWPQDRYIEVDVDGKLMYGDDTGYIGEFTIDPRGDDWTVIGESCL